VKWDRISRENFLAAKSLATGGFWRSSVCRAYYSVYAGISGELDGKVRYPAGRYGPSHDKLPVLVMTYLTSMRVYRRRQVSDATRQLYRYRIAADYEPPTDVGALMTRMALRNASFIVRSVSDGKS
jgi:hypothetical protein